MTSNGGLCAWFCAMAKILLVDDEAMIRKLIAMVLTQKGHEVLTACDGAEACMLVEKERPELIISDVKMPLVDGIDLIRSVQRDLPGTQCMLISGGTDFQDAKVIEQMRGIELCATLKKPFEVDELLRAVGRALEASALARVEAAAKGA